MQFNNEDTCFLGSKDSDDEEDYRKKSASKAKGKGKSTTKAKNNGSFCLCGVIFVSLLVNS